MSEEYINIVGKSVAAIIYTRVKKKMKILLVKKKSQLEYNQDEVVWRFLSETPKEGDKDDFETLERGLQEELGVYETAKKWTKPIDEFCYRSPKVNGNGVLVKVYPAEIKPSSKISPNPRELDGIVLLSPVNALDSLYHRQEKISLKKFLEKEGVNIPKEIIRKYSLY